MHRHVETLHEIGSLVAAADPLHEVLHRVVELIAFVIPCDACMIHFNDPNIPFFQELPEDRYEALLSVPLLSRGQTVGTINLHHRLPHRHTGEEIKFVSTIGFLVGSEAERARLQSEVAALTERLAARKIVERAKGILQSSMGVTEAEAYHTLQRQSRQRRKPMREIAEAILLAEEVREQRG